MTTSLVRSVARRTGLLAFDRNRSAYVLLAEADHHRPLHARQGDHVVELGDDALDPEPVGDIAGLRVSMT